MLITGVMCECGAEEDGMHNVPPVVDHVQAEKLRLRPAVPSDLLPLAAVQIHTLALVDRDPVVTIIRLLEAVILERRPIPTVVGLVSETSHWRCLGKCELEPLVFAVASAVPRVILTFDELGRIVIAAPGRRSSHC